jgi:curved DNA-binding protein CbpA
LKNFNFIDLYQLLGIPFNATDEQVKKAYRKRAKDYHPDTGGTEEEFILIKTAYEILSNENKRRNYDELYIQFQSDKQEPFHDYQKSEGKYKDNESVDQKDDLNKEENTDYKNEQTQQINNNWKYTGIFSIAINVILILTLSIGLYHFLGKNAAIYSLTTVLEEADKLNLTIQEDNKKLMEELTEMDRQVTVLKTLNNELEELNSKESEKESQADNEQFSESEATTITTRKKTEYLEKLNNIEKGLVDLEYLYESGITSEMLEAESETYKRWDDALNEIYGILMSQLSSVEMNKLRQEQRQWITDRDITAEVESLEFSGGTMESVQYISTLAQLSRDRCYELVQNYMH